MKKVLFILVAVFMIMLCAMARAEQGEQTAEQIRQETVWEETHRVIR